MSGPGPRERAAGATAGPLASPGCWLRHAALAWRRESGVRLRELDLAPTQFDVIGSLSWQSRDGELTQQMVADFAGIDRMMASEVIRTLEDRGLIERRWHPTDARALLLLLTDEGRRTARHRSGGIGGSPACRGRSYGVPPGIS